MFVLHVLFHVLYFVLGRFKEKTFPKYALRNIG